MAIKRTVWNGDVISGVCLGAFGTFVVTTSLNWSYSGTSGPGPAFFPFWYGIIILVLAIGLVISSIIRARSGTESNQSVDWPSLRRVAITWIAFATAVLLLTPLGFSISFGLLSTFLIIVVFKRSLLEAFLVSASGVLAFKVIFDLLLDIQLPGGVLGV